MQRTPGEGRTGSLWPRQQKKIHADFLELVLAD